MAIANDDTIVYEIVVYLSGIVHPCQEEIGIGRIYLFADRQHLECLYHTAPLYKKNLHPLVYLERILQGLKGLLLGEQVDIIRILHLIKYINDLLRCESHAQADCSTSPSL